MLMSLSLVDQERFGDFIRREFRQIGERYVERMIRLLGRPPDPANIPASFWRSMGLDLAQRVRPTLEQIYIAAARQLVEEVPPIAVNWNLINRRAADWAKVYSFDLVSKINATTRGRLQQNISSFFEQQQRLGRLESEIERYVPDLITRSGRLLTSAERATLIARTEVTRASVQGELAIVGELKAAGIEMVASWDTRNDSIVCPVCGPRNNKRQGDGWTKPPPGHPGCRCGLHHVPAAMLRRS